MHGHNAEAQQDSADSSSEHKHAAVASAPLYHTDHPSRHWDRTCPACIAESAQNDSGKRKNTPIADLMAEYTAENCDFTDMAWVRKAAMLYVDRMGDCQVRCLLHALLSESGKQERKA